MTEALGFDEWLDELRRRLLNADHLNDSTFHSFKELMHDHEDALPDHWYWEALEELKAVEHLHPDSHLVSGGDACGRLSADGRAYLRSLNELAQDGAG